MDKNIFPALLLETSRGCWWGEKVRCTFCGLSQDIIGFRSKSANRAMNEINELYEKYNIPFFELVDNILDKKYYETLLPTLSEDKRDLKFFYEIKANVAKHEVKLLADAGIFWVQPGIESLNDKVLKLLKKGAMSYHNIQLLKWCREYGILVSWNYLADVPNEKDEWYADELEMVPLLEHFQAPWNSGTPIRYDRFSVYALNQKEYGLDLVPTKAYDYIYDLTKEQISNLAYFFENRNLSIVNDGKERPIWEKLKEIMAKWREKFYVLGELGYLTEEPLNQELLPNLLIISDEDNKMVIKDTRSCAISENIELNGLETEIYRVCDEALSAGTIVVKLKDKNLDITQSEVENILDTLLKKKIMIFVSNRYLSLALQNPIRDYFRF